MTTLWEEESKQRIAMVEPLAARMRPRHLDEFAGQGHILGEGKLLRRMLDADRLTSVIFWGPPGTGKTALAEVIALHTGCAFQRAHAASVGVKEIRHILSESEARVQTSGQRTILFLDEIHRFARNQQDVLLGNVERGLITLIGATTENPYFAVNSALNSRSTILRFEPLCEADIATLLTRAIDDDRGFGKLQLDVTPEAIAHWAQICDGDARRALNALEVAVLSHSGVLATESMTIDLKCAEESIQAKALVYDGTGDEHYDVVSAFIKSMRGSDPDATVYWLARMLEAGEDPRFIARRIAILASEDIGNADPQAIQVAAAAWELTERLGLPECNFALTQAALYMATAPKSNASAKAIWAASKDVRDGRTLAVPEHLRDASYQGAKKLGHGQNYLSPHDSTDGYVPQEYLGTNRVYYIPTDQGFEAELQQRLKKLEARGLRGDKDQTPSHRDHE